MENLEPETPKFDRGRGQYVSSCISHLEIVSLRVGSDSIREVDGDLENFPQANCKEFKARVGVFPVGSGGRERKCVGVGHQVAGLEYVVYVCFSGYQGWADKGVGLAGHGACCSS